MSSHSVIGDVTCRPVITEEYRSVYPVPYLYTLLPLSRGGSREMYRLVDTVCVFEHIHGFGAKLENEKNTNILKMY